MTLQSKDSSSSMAASTQNDGQQYKTTTNPIRFMEPDVDIVVGVGSTCTTYKEYSVILGCLSEYFDAALSSGMKEADTRTFSFPNRDPTEWELLMSVFGLNPTVELQEDNIRTLLSWCSELCMVKAMKKCEQYYLENIITPKSHTLLTKKYSRKQEKESLKSFFESFDICIQYNLEKCIHQASGLLRYIYEDRSDILTYDEIEATVGYLKTNELFLDLMWSKFERYLPPSVLTAENADPSEHGVITFPPSAFTPENTDTKEVVRNSLDANTIFDNFMDKDNEYDPLSNSKRIRVKGAGSFRVNGTYNYYGEYEDFSVFCRRSRWNGDLCKYWLYKQHQNSYWYISVSSDSSGEYFPSTFNRSFYKSRSINRTRKNPPASRDSWIEHGSGKNPPPDIICTGEKIKDTDNAKKWTLKPSPPKRKYGSSLFDDSSSDDSL